MTPSQRRAVRITALGALLLGLLAPAADAKLVVNRSVGKVGLGMRTKEVTKALGSPQQQDAEGSVVNYLYAKRHLQVALTHGRVTLITTTNASEKTSKGAGVGATLARLRRAVSGERCGAKAGAEFCRVGSTHKGRRSTTFLIRDGRVSTVAVALGR